LSSSYQDLKEAFLKKRCSGCALGRKERIVFDRGNTAAKILIIGEAPGAEEAKTGRCFVGRSGKMLDRVLAGAGIDTNQDTLITNVVKCRPPSNRKPRPQEVERCRLILERQIESVRPKILVLLGATAFRRFFPEEKGPFKKFVGTFRKESSRGLPCLALYHPAFLLYSRKHLPEMERHVRLLKKYQAR